MFPKGCEDETTTYDFYELSHGLSRKSLSGEIIVLLIQPQRSPKI